MMPDMDGHRALEELRKVENGAGLPLERRAKVVMTTALSDYANFHRAYQASCDSYIVKPISKQVLVRQLRRIGLEPLS
jgi:two-component system chemotaxis response regulator CheY